MLVDNILKPVLAVTGTIYTCPMHPEIRQDHPGNCPKCGMTLEALIPELEEAGKQRVMLHAACLIGFAQSLIQSSAGADFP